MSEDHLERQRASLLEKLARIATATLEIDGELSPERHPRGLFYRPLKPKSGLFIIHAGTAGPSDNKAGTPVGGSITAVYRDASGREYDIRIRYTGGK